MTADSDLIRRGDALAAIQAELKGTYTAARRQGFKRAAEIVKDLPAKRLPPPDVPAVVISPGLGHSHWFYNGGFRLCYNCGAEDSRRKVPRFCSNCGFIMDELMELEIE